MDQLPRKLNLLDATFIVIGIVIGSGIFLLPNVIARNLPNGPVIIAVWVVSGILSFFGALAYAELGAMLPQTGGQYVYLREAFGPLCSFLCGWVFILAVTPAGVAFLATGFSIYLSQFIPLSPNMRTAVSLALVAILCAINYVGVRESAWTQRIFTAAKIGGLALVIGAAFLAPRVTHAATAPVYSYNGIGYAFTACLAAYNGWSFVSFVAGEVKNPERNLPRSLVLGMTVVMVLYVGANLAYMNVMTVPQIAAAERVGASVAERAMGPYGASILSAIVLLSIIGAINGNILTAPRIPFAQARDGLFFSRFGRIHPRFKTPSFAIVVLGSWAAILIVTGTYESLATYQVLSAWLFYTLGVLAVWVLRRKAPALPRPYKMWGYPTTLWLFVIVSIWFMADAIVNQPKTSLVAFVITASGIPLYYIWRAKNPAPIDLPAPDPASGS